MVGILKLRSVPLDSPFGDVCHLPLKDRSCELQGLGGRWVTGISIPTGLSTEMAVAVFALREEHQLGNAPVALLGSIEGREAHCQATLVRTLLGLHTGR